MDGERLPSKRPDCLLAGSLQYKIMRGKNPSAVNFSTKSNLAGLHGTRDKASRPG